VLGRILKELVSSNRQKPVKEPHRDPYSDELKKGFDQYRSGDFRAAEKVFLSIIQHAPNHVDALNLMGELCAKRGQIDISEKWYWKALQSNPKSAQTRVGLGLLLYEKGDLKEAHTQLKEANRLQPDNVEILSNLGVVDVALGNTESATEKFQAALRINPNFAHSWNNLGIIAKKIGNSKKALYCFKKAIVAKPDFGLALSNYGLALRDEEQLVDAEQHLREAIRLAPNNSQVRINFGLLLIDLQNLSEAQEQLQEALRINPNNADVHTALGLLFKKLGDVPRAFHHYQCALKINPDAAEANFGLGELYLWLGNFQEGWHHYEFRRFSNESPIRHFPYPEWDGQPLEGRTLLVYAEQGLGDIIMFGSCLSDVISQADHCIIECPARLSKLMARSFPKATVQGTEANGNLDWLDKLPPVHNQIAIGSLPRFCGNSPSGFPSHRGYLQASSDRVAYWQQRLQELGKENLKIGVAWRGGLIRTDRIRRSIDLEELSPIFTLPQIRCVSLQYGKCQDELAMLQANHGIDLPHWQEAIDDLDETAALVNALDLVICVCSTLVHLGGALGRPVWVLTPDNANWRYLKEGSSLPWYPTVRLFRQTRKGDWSEVITKVLRQLEKPQSHFSTPC